MPINGQIVRDVNQIDMDVRTVTCDMGQCSLMPFCAPFSISFDGSETRFLFAVP